MSEPTRREFLAGMGLIVSAAVLPGCPVPPELKPALDLNGGFVIPAELEQQLLKEISDNCFIRSASGVHLDKFGAIYGHERKPGEGDPAFRARIEEWIMRPPFGRTP